MKQSAEKVLHTISRLSADAEWTEEELKESICQEGGNPDEFLRRTLPQIASLADRLKHQKSDKVKPGVTGTARSKKQESRREVSGTFRTKRSKTGKVVKTRPVKRKGDAGSSAVPKRDVG